MASLISSSTNVSSWGRMRECYPRLSHYVCERCEIAKRETCSVLSRGVDYSLVTLSKTLSLHTVQFLQRDFDNISQICDMFDQPDQEMPHAINVTPAEQEAIE